MLRQLLVGGAVSLVNITIHALVMTTVVRVAQAARVHKRFASVPVSDGCYDPDRVDFNDHSYD